VISPLFRGAANDADPPRLALLRRFLKKKRLDGFLVLDLSNIRYLTGFTGSSGLLFITRKEQFFLTDFRYKEQSEREVKDWTVIIEKGDRVRRIANLCRKTGTRSIGVESSAPYSFYCQLSRSGVPAMAVDGLVERLRAVKTSSEVARIKRAVERAEEAFLEVKPFIRPGVSEWSLAQRLADRLRRKGCRKLPFDIIVASGAQSALPHAKPTEKKISRGDFVLIDWGGEADGYYSDMTRTLLVSGENTRRQEEMYNVVLEANETAIAAVKPGVRSKDIDRAARECIRRSGYGDFFGHGTGHGVGLQVHEAPRISWQKSTAIAENMIFTIEPGIYVPGIGGVRIEDMVVVRKTGAEVLTSLRKELDIL